MSSSYLPYQQFERDARELVDISARIGDGWELKTIKICSEPETIFLSKTITNHTIDTAEKDSIELTNDVLLDLVGPSEVEDVIDPAVAISHLPTLQQTVCVEYHIVYSDSYEVPILYFNATQSNGQQLSLDDIWKIVSKDLTSSNPDRWSLVSQQEHPLLGRPFYHVHPCHTAKVMGKALTVLSCEQHRSETMSSNGGTNSPNYLIAWLSTFGPLVGLRVPLGFVRAEE